MKVCIVMLAVILLAGLSEAKIAPGYSTWLDYYRSEGYSYDIKAGAQSSLIELKKGGESFFLNAQLPKNNAQKVNASQGDYLGYSDTTVFLVPDGNWRSVLAFTPVALWVGSDADKAWCNSVYGTGSPYSSKCAYPLLVYHQEGNKSDMDSILHFFQQYGAKQVVHVGELSDKLRGVITRATGNPPIQADPTKPYIFWRQTLKYVYVSDNYGLAMLAAQYAAYTNSPLIIKGQSNIPLEWWQKASEVEGGIVCIGEAPAPGLCEVWDKQRLFEEILAIAPSDKVLAVDSGDLIGCGKMLYVTYTDDNLTQFYCKDSLIAPYLAAAKEEIIIDLARGGRENFIGVEDDTAEQVVSRASITLEEAFSRLVGMPQPGEAPITKIAKYFTFLISPVAEDTPAIGWDDDGTKVIDKIYGSSAKPQYGRVFGLTVSDTSTYISRSIFMDRIQSPPLSKDVIGLFAGWDADFTFTAGSKIGDPLYSEDDIKSERTYFTLARRITPAYLGSQPEQPDLASIQKSAKSGSYSRECIDTDTKHVTPFTSDSKFAWFESPEDFGMIIADGKIVSADECIGDEISDKPGYTNGIYEMQCASDGTYSRIDTLIAKKICSVSQGALINDVDSDIDAFMGFMHGSKMTISLCSNRADKDCIDEKTECAKSTFVRTKDVMSESETIIRLVPGSCKFKCMQGYGCVDESFCVSVTNCPDTECYECTSNKCVLKTGKRYCTNGKGCIENTQCCDCASSDSKCWSTHTIYVDESSPSAEERPVIDVTVVKHSSLECLPEKNKCNFSEPNICAHVEKYEEPDESPSDYKKSVEEMYCSDKTGCIEPQPFRVCADGRIIGFSECCQDCKESEWKCEHETMMGAYPTISVLAKHYTCQKGKCAEGLQFCTRDLFVPEIEKLTGTALSNYLSSYMGNYCLEPQGCIKRYNAKG